MGERVSAVGGPEGDDGLIGRVLDGRFRIEEKLGEGGLGAVFRASQVRVGRPMAVKVLHPQYAENTTLRRRFEREARSLGALRHPAIVDVIDYGIDGSAPYLVMELLEGRPLDVAIREGLSYERALSVWRELVAAVAYAHDRGVIHRDLKPGNVFLQRVPDGDEVARVLDFGLAKFTDEPEHSKTALTRAGAIMGTPAYMSPEQASGGATDAATDVYSLGILGYELLAGQRPFTGNTSDLFRKHLLEDLPRVAAVQPDLPGVEQLDAILAKATAKSRKQRLGDARELLVELDAFMQRASKTQVPSTQAGGGAAMPAPSVPESEGLFGNVSAGTAATVVAGAAGRAKKQADSARPTGGGSEEASQPVALPRRRGTRWGQLAVGLALAAGLVWFVAGPVMEPVPAAPRGPASPAVAAGKDPRDAPDAPSEAADTTTDLLANLPPGLQTVLHAQRPGARLSTATRRKVFRWQRAHRGDPRGWLLMADLDMAWGARSDALRWYEKALSADPGAKRDASMQRNVMVMAGHGAVGAKAKRLARKVWGAEGVALIDRVLQHEKLSKDERRRLERFRASLESD